jgi:hypothetical protein
MNKRDAYVSNSQQSAIKEHHHAHQHEKHSERCQSNANLYSFNGARKKKQQQC